VAPVPNHNDTEGAPGPSLLGTGDIDTMREQTSICMADTSMTLPLACLLSAASVHTSISTGKERDGESRRPAFIRYIHVFGHEHHTKVYRWFRALGSKDFSTCAMTQSGFVRLFSNPTIYRARVSHESAVAALGNLTSRREHTFWPMDVDYETATTPLRGRITGHKQIADAYLLGLAIHHRGRLATMDHGIVELAGPEFADSVELIA
jgi:toxin-antitoxin system PIN domain toxin